jgi:hypothetical protein
MNVVDRIKVANQLFYNWQLIVSYYLDVLNVTTVWTKEAEELVRVM